MTHPTLELAPIWDNVQSTLRSPAFQNEVLPAYVRSCRWFGGKARHVSRVEVSELLNLGAEAGYLALLTVSYEDGAPEVYLLPLQLSPRSPGVTNVIAEFRSEEGAGFLVDASDDAAFRDALFRLMRNESIVASTGGSLVGICGETLRAESANAALPSRVLKAEQSNTSIVYDGRFFLKLYRKPELGENPDAEILRYLSERRHFPHVPTFCGALEFQGAEGTRVLGLLVANVPNRGDAWSSTLEQLDAFFRRVIDFGKPAADADDAATARSVGDDFPPRARQLGERTAEMHLALAAETADSNFIPEPFSESDQRAVAESMTASTRRMGELLARELPHVPAAAREDATALLGLLDEIARRQQQLLTQHINATRIRHHGDYHLGQILDTGSDFIIIDFEGEPARPLEERRQKRTPLRDVAGMLRSFHYAAHSGLARIRESHPDSGVDLSAWAELWFEHIARAFLDAYLSKARGASFLPTGDETLKMLLDVCLLEKAVYEVCYELNNRPDWVHIPVRGILRIIQQA